MNASFILQHMRNTHNLLIGELTAEKFILRVESQPPSPEDGITTITIRGRNLITGLPTAVGISVFELRDAWTRAQNRQSDIIDPGSH